MPFIVATLAALVVGCGGGADSDATRSVATGSEAEAWRGEMNAICTDAADQLGALPDVQAPADVLPWLRAALDISDQEIDDLDAVSAPADVKERAHNLVRGLEAAHRELRSYITALEGGADPAQVVDQVNAASDRLFAPLNEEASELGLSACADDTAPSERVKA